ncbi:helix-turn-helix domain-containing protein [Paenibacillus radicis (ex Xue et al. 2023)]|uniref:AraC family transcriptional regulator n=1 Tax=Paenibacillus radicis (ex Xue et al. 2023) TaxID=2972489 RepID=A0ABT1YD89_9BACL|nr:helix-turn-helix domain-containing protein [Paenibacillus radicis (ex Xue et al. 2023)]MCR8630374.1 AraC family transcriptional regulator [Paenibacillus radicis (ex Xue et al. 2023)]
MNSQPPYTPTGMLLSNFRSHKEEQLRMLEHYHDSFELAYFVNADIQLFIKDTKYQVTNGDYLFINEYEVHRIFYNPRHHYTRYVINFKKSFISSLLKEAGLVDTLEWIVSYPRRKLELSSKQRLEIEERFRRINTLYSQLQQKEDPLGSSELKLNLLLLLIKYREFATANQSKYAPKKDVVKELISYIDRCYSDPIKLEDLERISGMSRYHISRLFKNATHFTIVEYIQQRRVIEAQIKLKQTDRQVLDIGLECGFQNAQHFHRVFRTVTGQSPLQFRKLVVHDFSP